MGVRAQRRADEFDSLVERHLDRRDQRRGRPARRRAPRAGRRAARRPRARSRVRSSSPTCASRLMAEAETALVPTDVARLQLPARHTTRERRIAGASSAASSSPAPRPSVAVGCPVGAARRVALPDQAGHRVRPAAASRSARPARAAAELANATSRLDEVDGADPGPRTSATRSGSPSTLGTFTDQATAGADLLLSDYAAHRPRVLDRRAARLRRRAAWTSSSSSSRTSRTTPATS